MSVPSEKRTYTLGDSFYVGSIAEKSISSTSRGGPIISITETASVTIPLNQSVLISSTIVSLQFTLTIPIAIYNGDVIATIPSTYYPDINIASVGLNTTDPVAGTNMTVILRPNGNLCLVGTAAAIITNGFSIIYTI